MMLLGRTSDEDLGKHLLHIASETMGMSSRLLSCLITNSYRLGAVSRRGTYGGKTLRTTRTVEKLGFLYISVTDCGCFQVVLRQKRVFQQLRLGNQRRPLIDLPSASRFLRDCMMPTVRALHAISNTEFLTIAKARPTARKNCAKFRLARCSYLCLRNTVYKTGLS